MARSKSGGASKDTRGPVPPPRRWRMPVALLLRMFLLGSVSILAAGYAIYRYYTVPRAPMLVPAPPPTEIPAPDLDEPPPAPSR